MKRLLLSLILLFSFHICIADEQREYEQLKKVAENPEAAIQEYDRTISQEKKLDGKIRSVQTELQKINEDLRKAEEGISKAKQELNALSSDSAKSFAALAQAKEEQTAFEKEQVIKAENERLWWNQIIVWGVALIIITVIAVFIYSRYRQKKLKQIAAVKAELNIAQEKLMEHEIFASKGEVTAGVAHEIRNPLNFINNFTDVSKELIDEYLKTAEFDSRKELLESIRDNIEKVNVHGKRAANIIGSMKEEQKQRTNFSITVLLHECVVLATYNNQVKPFKITEEYDASLKDVMGNRSDLQRVFLNLITNSVYTLNKKAEKMDENWKPELIVKASRRSDHVYISISDNGEGIPEKTLEKLFTPFFTTKPAGHGTGLGLSMSKEIIELHNGSIAVNTQHGQGCSFYITIPI